MMSDKKGAMERSPLFAFLQKLARKRLARRRRLLCQILLPLLLLSAGLLYHRTSPTEKSSLKNSFYPSHENYPSLHNTSVINESSGSLPETKCKPHRPDENAAKKIMEHYGLPGRIENRQCDGPRYQDICSFNTTKSGEELLSCDAKVCGLSAVKIASVNSETGKAVNDWKTLTNETITASVREAVKTNLERGLSFLFLKCGSIFQVLTFPPVFKKVESGENIGHINVNIIVLDSISRPHFYRTLPRASQALHKINQDSNIKATALDFELVQSIGQQTFENLRPFFCGVLKDDNEVDVSGENRKAPLGVEVLYGAFQKWGYQTFFQEDLCWYDIWGCMLSDIEKRAPPKQDSEFKERWREFQQKVIEKRVDHQGITHFSCTALDRIGLTNHYDRPQKVCVNGMFYSWYFFDYLTKVYTALKNHIQAKPLVSYMHFNTGHETTGKRTINMDAIIAKFVSDMASFTNTLTVIFSDHGHTRTPFSYTEEGRRELFDPMFFMIVPDGVKEKMGAARMGALITNQKRLFMLSDVHKAFMSLNDPQKMNSKDYKVTGIFSEIPVNRTCADLYMLPLTRYKCEGFDEEIPVKDNADDHTWLAEFAVGYINDAIQKQYMSGNDGSPRKYGYGNCKRLVGKSFEEIVKRFRGEYILTTMDIHVAPPAGYTEDEVYKVSLKQHVKPEHGVLFLSSVRQTLYNKFASCADESVDIKLCACAKKQGADIMDKEVAFDDGVPRKMFGSDTVVKNLDSNCLLFLRRNFGTYSFAIEVANNCTTRTYKLKLTGNMDQRLFSNTVPITRELSPRTFYFLTSVYKYIAKVNTALDLAATVHMREEGSDTFNFIGTFTVS